MSSAAPVLSLVSEEYESRETLRRVATDTIVSLDLQISSAISCLLTVDIGMLQSDRLAVETQGGYGSIKCDFCKRSP
jgi:predicted proteasome-type protease